jgi:TDG/mug DNA glycosylase family protein
MNKVHGFPAIADSRAVVLILGSMPGIASLEKNQYYGLPRNAFWRIMGDLVGAGPEQSYAARLDVLKNNGIALWDVLASCNRPGSLDSAIDEKSIKTNDFQSLLEDCPNLQQIFFNGRKAESIFMRRVAPTLAPDYPNIGYTPLPSTSPAMAALSYQQKLEAWSAIAPWIG